MENRTAARTTVTRSWIPLQLIAVSSERSAWTSPPARLAMTALDEDATARPTIAETTGPVPSASPTNAVETPTVTNTWRGAAHSTVGESRRMRRRSSSRPTSKRRRTTPMSARTAISVRSATKPGVNGPTTMPAASQPMTSGRPTLRAIQPASAARSRTNPMSKMKLAVSTTMLSLPAPRSAAQAATRGPRARTVVRWLGQATLASRGGHRSVSSAGPPALRRRRG